VDCRLANAPWKSFGCAVLFSGVREETVVLDTREAVEVDAKDISEVGGWLDVLWFVRARGLNWLSSRTIRRRLYSLRHDCVGTAVDVFKLDLHGDHDVGY
jgi:hypothetical protein